MKLWAMLLGLIFEKLFEIRICQERYWLYRKIKIGWGEIVNGNPMLKAHEDAGWITKGCMLWRILQRLKQ